MAELTINTGDITAAIRKNLEGFTPDVSLTQVGRVVEVGDGIARVSGLPDAAVNELLEFESGVVGLALNLDEESIGAVVLGEVESIEEGQSVKATGEILSVPVGDGVLGRVVNTLGEPVDGKRSYAAAGRGWAVPGADRHCRTGGSGAGRRAAGTRAPTTGRAEEC